jgi:sec-independent protein translocase protein TatB
MFDITSSKLLLLGIVALLVIGPKDFPALLRTIGKYMGMIRGHAREFRAQFDEAMRESELADLKKNVENIAQETEASFRESTRSVEDSLAEARQTIDTSIEAPKVEPDPMAHDANGIPIAQAQHMPGDETAHGLNGTMHTADAPAVTPGETPPQPAEQNRPAEKSGA